LELYRADLDKTKAAARASGGDDQLDRLVPVQGQGVGILEYKIFFLFYFKIMMDIFQGVTKMKVPRC